MPEALNNPADHRRAWHLPLLVAVWVMVFLPALGGPEYKGEEPRRVQPALAMMGSGEWIVPHVGGEPYFNKPPLINWLVAAAFAIGGQSEAAARSISSISMLAMLIGIYLLSRHWIGADRALFAAIAATFHSSLIDKGRLIEIEPLYVALFSLALGIWLWAFHLCTQEPGRRDNGRAGVALWILPWFFLGLGILAKGPLHILFFYAAIVPVLLFARRARELFSPWHFGGIGVGIAMVAAWAVPLFARIPREKAVKTWEGQMASRIAGEPDRLESFEFLLNLPKTLANFLPWILLLAAVLFLVWRGTLKLRKAPPPEPVRNPMDTTGRGLLVGFLPLLILLGLIPGILPRYTMPLFTPAAIWLAIAIPSGHPALLNSWSLTIRLISALIGAGAIASLFLLLNPADGVYSLFALGCALGGWFAFARGRRLDQLAARTALIIAGATLIYAAVAVPRMTAHDDVRPVGGEILARTGPGARICIIDPESRPFIAYLPPEISFASKFNRLPDFATHAILKTSDLVKLDPAERERLTDEWSFKDRGREEFLLARIKKPLPPPPAD